MKAKQEQEKNELLSYSNIHDNKNYKWEFLSESTTLSPRFNLLHFNFLGGSKRKLFQNQNC